MGNSISHILSIGNDSLQNSRAGIEVTGHNIANAQTPGYSRQQIYLESRGSAQQGGLLFGNGVDIQTIRRSHDALLENQLRKETQSQSRAETLKTGLEKIENIFSSQNGVSLRDGMTNLANALRDLANSPEETAVRLSAVGSANELSEIFHKVHKELSSAKNETNREIGQTIDDLNQKLKQIAHLGNEIGNSGKASNQEANDLEDKRDKLLQEVASFIDIRVSQDKQGRLMVKGPGESLLVDGPLVSSFSLKDEKSGKGQPSLLISHFDSPQFSDVTGQVKEGQLGALFALRDNHLQKTTDEVNALAKRLAQDFNRVHKTGYGHQQGTPAGGIAFFVGSEDSEEPARDICLHPLLTKDAGFLATASRPGAVGDNTIAHRLAALLSSGKSGAEGVSTSLVEDYDRIVAKAGIVSREARAEAETANTVLSGLKAQRESLAGVSLDEEAAQLSKYQNLFAASAKMISTVDEMFKTILDLKR